MNEDVVSGDNYRYTVHRLTQEARSAQRLVEQLTLWVFTLAGSTAFFAIVWLFEVWVR